MRIRKILKQPAQQQKKKNVTTVAVSAAPPKRGQGLGHDNPFTREGRGKWRDVAARNFE